MTMANIKKMITTVSALILITIILASCTTITNKDLSDAYGEEIASASSMQYETPLEMGSEKFASIRIKDLADISEYTLPSYKEFSDNIIIQELCSLLGNLEYKETDEKCEKYHQVELLDKDQNLCLAVTFGAREICFDRAVMVGDKVLNKGTYAVNNWIYHYSKALYEGEILDPVHIEYPASVKIPEEYFSVELIDKGDTKVNLYKVSTQLYDLIDNLTINREFEIVSSERVYDINKLEAQMFQVKNQENCIVIQFSNSETYLDITSSNEYKEKCSGYNIIVSKSYSEPFLYKLITDNMILYVRVTKNFDNVFQNIFTTNRSTSRQVTPAEINSLFDSGKPNYMDFISKNLGISKFPGRSPDKLTTTKMKLNNQSTPYTVLSFLNPFDLRMLIFRQDKENDWRFIDYIDYGGHFAGTDYSLEKIGDEIFLSGNICKGHGTGESSYYKEWYTINDDGKSLVLSYPYDDYIEGPFGGYTVQTDKATINRNRSISLSVDFSIQKRYLLDLDISNKDGMAEIEGTKNITFLWDKKRKSFIREVAVHGLPQNQVNALEISSQCQDITKTCDSMLEKYYDKLLEMVKSIEDEKDAYTVQNVKDRLEYFLNDCTDSVKKTKIKTLGGL